MAHPVRKHTRSRRDKRRANWKADIGSVAVASVGSQGKPASEATFVLPHRICPETGYYRGRQILPVKPPKAKKDKNA